MQTYKRKITYFYQFHNGKVGSTAGFLKLEIRGDRVKIIINIQEPPGLPYKGGDLYFYHEAGDHLSAVCVDKVDSIDGVLTYHTRTDWQRFYDTGRDLYTFDGVMVVYNENHYYLGDFKDKDRSGIPIKFNVQKKPAPEKIENNEEVSDIEDIPLIPVNKKREPEKESQPEATDFLKCENCPYQEKRKEIKGETDSFEKILEEYPKLPVYGATELFQCVRIHPKDIGKLDMRNWKLGVNSFLTHGYYTYQYLLLGKMRFTDGLEHPIIGVPGVYSNREKYLANMFGFEQFVPVKKTGIKTGEFGYWVVEINN